MKLYFSPGSCSLSPHIALREAGLPFDLERVDLRAKKTSGGEDYLAINPKGYVPAVLLDDGELLTEGAIIVQYIADQRPELRLAPPQGTPERRRLQEWLHFIATELHKGFGPINNPRASAELRRRCRRDSFPGSRFWPRGSKASATWSVTPSRWPTVTPTTCCAACGSSIPRRWGRRRCWAPTSTPSHPVRQSGPRWRRRGSPRSGGGTADAGPC
jgi:glutathione S-transferase-like protein